MPINLADQRERKQLRQEQTKETRALIKEQARRRARRIEAIPDAEWTEAGGAPDAEA